jgi:hypothetical protein
MAAKNEIQLNLYIWTYERLYLYYVRRGRSWLWLGND